MRRQKGVSVLEFLLWLGLASIVVGSSVVFYRRAQNEQAALELQRKLDHLVKSVRKGFEGREFYTRDGTPYGPMISSTWLRSASGIGLTVEDFSTREFGTFVVGPSFALGDTYSAFRVQSPPFGENRAACISLVQFAIEYLEPLQVEVSTTSAVVWTRGGTVSRTEAALAACPAPNARQPVPPVRFDFS